MGFLRSILCVLFVFWTWSPCLLCGCLLPLRIHFCFHVSFLCWQEAILVWCSPVCLFCFCFSWRWSWVSKHVAKADVQDPITCVFFYRMYSWFPRSLIHSELKLCMVLDNGLVSFSGNGCPIFPSLLKELDLFHCKGWALGYKLVSCGCMPLLCQLSVLHCCASAF